MDLSHYNWWVFLGGFGSYLFGMSEIIAKQSHEANAEQNTKNPSLVWMIAFLFVVSFLGLFSVVPLRKVHLIINNPLSLSVCLSLSIYSVRILIPMWIYICYMGQLRSCWENNTISSFVYVMCFSKK